MLNPLGVNLIQDDVVIHQIPFFMLIARNPIMAADMTLWRDKDNFYSKLRSHSPEALRKNTRPLGFGKLDFTHN
ncbi:hypothetical protein D3C77_557340 [compost metagenome]